MYLMEMSKSPKDELANHRTIAISDLLLFLVRFYVIFCPFSALIVKVSGTVELKYWKDIFYLLCSIIGFIYIYQYRQIKIYLTILLIIVLQELLLDRMYFEYITWLTMGFPLIVYFRLITKEKFDIDSWIISLLMIIAGIWVFFFESNGGFEFTFMEEILDSRYTPLRDDILRTRFCFTSPMAFSQYIWFSLMLILLNPRINYIYKFFFLIVEGYLLYEAHTRAGQILLLMSLLFLLSNKLVKLQGFKVIILYLIVSSLLILQIILSGLDDSGKSLSDAKRILELLDGIQSSIDNFPLGKGGLYYSPRSIFGESFESSWLSSISSFGWLGFLIIGYYLYYFLFIKKSISILLFSLPWVIYSTVFPILQEMTPLFITWYIIGLIWTNDKKELISLKLN